MKFLLISLSLTLATSAFAQTKSTGFSPAVEKFFGTTELIQTFKISKHICGLETRYGGVYVTGLGETGSLYKSKYGYTILLDSGERILYWDFKENDLTTAKKFAHMLATMKVDGRLSYGIASIWKIKITHPIQAGNGSSTDKVFHGSEELCKDGSDKCAAEERKEANYDIWMTHFQNYDMLPSGRCDGDLTKNTRIFFPTSVYYFRDGNVKASEAKEVNWIKK